MDLLVAGLAITIAGVLTTESVLSGAVILSALKPGALLLGCWVGAIYIQGLYSKAPTRSRLVLGWLVFRCLFAASMVAIILSYWLGVWLAGRLFYVVATAIMISGTMGTRLWLMARSRHFSPVPRVLLVGNEGLRHIEFLMQNLNDFLASCIVGYIDAGHNNENRSSEIPLPQAGHPDELPQIVQQQEVSHIALCDSPSDGTELQKILNTSAVHQVKVTTLAALLMELTEQIPIFEMAGQCDLPLAQGRRTIYGERFQRLVGIAVCLVALPIALPLMGLAAIAIKLTSPGPVLYRQERVGKGGRLFTIMKLRTMKEDAEKDTGAVWASKDDPRVTPVGRILRQTRLDELPQLFNVLRGDMSLIGPRPERPEFVEQFKQIMPMYDLRHSVRPGITGWGQVNSGYDTSVDTVFRRLRYDLYHIRNTSLSLDLRIILRTVSVMLNKWRAR